MLTRTLTFALLLTLTLPTHAQSTQPDIAARLIGKSLLLRGLWSDDKLAFDATGAPRDTYTTGSFTLAAVDIQTVSLQGTHLTLKGQRIGLTFEQDGTLTRQPIHTAHHKSEKLTIEIDGPLNDDFTQPLDAVFANLADITPSLPDFWQPYAHHYLLHDGPPLDAKNPSSLALSPTDQVTHIGGTIKPPSILKSVEPRSSDAARYARLSGSVSVYLIVDENGMPTNVRLVRPAGLGLDEEAVKAVRQYRFKPATKDGKPVAVDLYMDLNYTIF